MHHVVLERWSRGSTLLHRADPRAKIAILLLFLVLLATARHGLERVGTAYLLFLVAGIAAARVPFGGALARAATVLPFSTVFGAITWLAGDPERAVHLVVKSYLSALAVLLLVATTPLPALFHGLEWMRTPRFLLMVVQFLYRYLFVISEEAQHMRIAAASRGAVRGRAGFRAAAGALAVLFARSYARAENVHRAMLSRGFQGDFKPLATSPFRWTDAAFLGAAAALVLALRFALEPAPA